MRGDFGLIGTILRAAAELAVPGGVCQVQQRFTAEAADTDTERAVESSAADLPAEGIREASQADLVRAPELAIVVDRIRASGEFLLVRAQIRRRAIPGDGQMPPLEFA
jgi:hypothetical protein